MSDSCFQLKSANLSMTVLELHYFDATAFENTLREKIRQAPSLLKDAPLIVSLERFSEPASQLDFFQIIGTCRRHGMHVVAVRGGDDDMRRLARNASLSLLPTQSARDRAEPSSPATPTADATPASAPAPVTSTPAPAVPEPAPAATSAANDAVATQAHASRIVHQPVRSGQQIYEANGDLIVLAPVGAGAEVMAAGNVHVYGPIRGRVLAGVHGDTQARIFCQSLEAELVSIGGHYKISEDLQGSYWKRPVQIQLKDDALIITPLD